MIFDNALMHAWEDNATQRDRVAVSLVLKPRQAPLVHYAAESEGAGRAWKYRIDESFFVDYGLFDDLGALKDRQPVNLNQPACPLWKFRLSHFVHKMTA